MEGHRRRTRVGRETHRHHGLRAEVVVAAEVVEEAHPHRALPRHPGLLEPPAVEVAAAVAVTLVDSTAEVVEE